MSTSLARSDAPKSDPNDSADGVDLQADPASDAGAGTGRPRRFRWLPGAALALTLLLSAGLVALHVSDYTVLSPYDEMTHIDYTYRVLDGGVVSAGDTYTPEARHDFACRGVDFPVAVPPCDGPAKMTDFPGAGFNTAYIHSPAYYAVTGVLSLPLRVLPGDAVDAMRLTGAAWLALALVLLWVVLRDLGVGWPVRMAAGLVLTAVPSVLLTQSTVNNDATALAAGAALVLAALRWDRGRLHVAWLGGLAVVAMLLKSTNLAVLLAVVGFVLIRAVQRRAPSTSAWRALLDRKPLISAAVVGGGIVVGGLAWTLVYPRLATVDPTTLATNLAFVHDTFQPYWLAEQIGAITSPLFPQFYDSAVSGGLAVALAQMANYGLLAVAVVGAVRAAPGGQIRALGAATGIAMAAFGPLMAVINFVVAHAYFMPLPARYGLSLVPALIVVGASAIRSPRAQAGALVVGGAAFVAMTAQLVIAG